ncbi:DUF4255 domain-containing protein [Streptomyces pseudogriseolus]|uniref:DUF4255 domain-containing protein n=1 Tax=Streptomyces pseudogriseolus TaxID=36817 RepID=UPI003FA2BA92
MSTGQAIAAVTQTIQKLLQPAAPLVSARTPDQARGTNGRQQLNLFLYDISPNPSWRNQEPPGRSAGGSLHPPLAVDLRYLLTAYSDTDDEAPAHAVLGEAMRILHDGAVLARDLLRGVLEAAGVHLQPDSVRLTPQQLGSGELSTLWSAFQTSYRLSVAYQASVVLIDTATPPPVALPVLRRGGIDPHQQGRPESPPVAAVPGPLLERVTVQAWRGNAAFPARTGDGLVMEGRGLAATTVRARFDHPRLTAPLWAAAAPGSTAERVLVALPDDLPPGLATVTVALGTPNGPDRDVVTVSNSLPLPVAVRLSRPALGPRQADGTACLTVRCDRLAASQDVRLLFQGAQYAPTGKAAAGADIAFGPRLSGPAGTAATLLLRVDGVDSVPLPDPDPAQPLPTGFDPAQQVVLT